MQSMKRLVSGTSNYYFNNLQGKKMNTNRVRFKKINHKRNDPRRRFRHMPYLFEEAIGYKVNFVQDN
jgi:hypothetical protein